MKVLIIEDEKIAADNLENLLHDFDKNIQVIRRIETVKDAITYLPDMDVDLIFLDVHLADDICFKIFDSVEVNTPIIFTTAYDQYALRAFRLNSIDYLLKPIDSAELRRSLEKFRKLSISTNLDIKGLIEAFNTKKQEYQKRFVITVGEKIRSVPIENVAYFFGQEKYVYLITCENQRYILDYTLAKLEEMLDPEEFFRINRQFLISFQSIANMYAYSRGRIKVDLNPAHKEEAIVSIDRSGSFKNWLNR